MSFVLKAFSMLILCGILGSATSEAADGTVCPITALGRETFPIFGIIQVNTQIPQSRPTSARFAIGPSLECFADALKTDEVFIREVNRPLEVRGVAYFKHTNTIYLTTVDSEGTVSDVWCLRKGNRTSDYNFGELEKDTKDTGLTLYWNQLYNPHCGEKIRADLIPEHRSDEG